MVRHPVLFLIALTAVMVAAALSVSSTVEVALVGTSWVGLDSSVGIGVSVVCSVFALAAMAVLFSLALSSGFGEGDDDDDRGGDDEPPEPEGPSGEPAWWPDFEREFGAYQSTVGAAISSGSASSSRVLK